MSYTESVEANGYPTEVFTVYDADFVGAEPPRFYPPSFTPGLLGSYRLSLGIFGRVSIQAIPDSSGIYIFVGRNHSQENWNPIYVGTSKNVRERLRGHEKMSYWRRQSYHYKAFLVLSTPYWSRDQRLRYEKALIDTYRTDSDSYKINSARALYLLRHKRQGILDT